MIQTDFKSLNNERSNELVNMVNYNEVKKENENFLESETKTVSNFPNEVNTELAASGHLNKYDLLNPPYLNGIDASIDHIYSEIQ